MLNNNSYEVNSFVVYSNRNEPTSKTLAGFKRF